VEEKSAVRKWPANRRWGRNGLNEQQREGEGRIPGSFLLGSNLEKKKKVEPSRNRRKKAITSGGGERFRKRTIFKKMGGPKRGKKKKQNRYLGRKLNQKMHP